MMTDRDKPMRILLMDTAYLGDLVLATPLLRAAAESLGGGRIDVLTSPAGAAVLAHHPLVDEMFIYRKRDAGVGLAGFGRARAWIRSRTPEAALLPRRSLRSLLLARAAGVPRRVGFGRWPASLLLTDTVAFDSGLHQVDRNLELLRPLGVEPGAWVRPGKPLEVYPSAEDRAAVDGWLAEQRLPGARAFFALAPGSVWATKRWPLERYAALAAALAPRLPVVVIGGAGEADLAHRLLAQMPAVLRPRLHDATDRFTPAGSVYLLSRAAALVSNDSGALHLGQAAGTRVVAIYGPTAPVLGYAPRGAGHEALGVEGLDCRPCGRHGASRCPRGHWRCMLDLGVETVAEAALRAAGEAAA